MEALSKQQQRFALWQLVISYESPEEGSPDEEGIDAIYLFDSLNQKLDLLSADSEVAKLWNDENLEWEATMHSIINYIAQRYSLVLKSALYEGSSDGDSTHRFFFQGVKVR
jgi:hypothetical protein